MLCGFFMANFKNTQNHELKIQKWIKEGRGQGFGNNYKPWITIRDVSSEGRSHRVFGHKSQRIHHLLSDLELSAFLLLEWHSTTIDIFQSFLLLLSQSQIDGWTSNKIWNKLNLSKDEKQRINQQQLYRLLRKLVHQGHLIKNIHLDNPRLSTFNETKSMDTFRKQFDIKTLKNDAGKLGFKTKQLKEKQKIYENQIRASEQALIDFPELKIEIMRRKNQLLQDIEKLKAYTDFLTSLI
jgi:hypothetical protein